VNGSPVVWRARQRCNSRKVLRHGLKGYGQPLIGITLTGMGIPELKTSVPAPYSVQENTHLLHHCNDPVIIAESIDGLLIPGGGDIDLPTIQKKRQV